MTDTQPLFLDKPLVFTEKLAGTLTHLSDNTDLWPQQITQEAHKQLPYLGSFQTDVVLDKIDEEKGFAFGSIVVKSQTEMTTKEEGAADVSVAHIPIVIKEQMLYPFDVFLAGKDYSFLTEGRLREELYRPNTFDAVRERPPDVSLMNELSPPFQSGGGGFSGSGAKLGHIVPLLPQLHGTIKAGHKERFSKVAMQDHSLIAAYANAPEGVRAVFESALNLTVSDPVKTAEVAWASIRPNVVQIRKLANGNCILKYANTEMFAPQEQEVPPAAAEELLGDQDLVSRLESDGSITMSPEATQNETLDVGDTTVVNQFGLWAVQDTVGNELTGWGFPQLMSMDLQPMPLILFSNGSQYAIQDQIAGRFISKSTSIPKGAPRGYGCLYYIDHGTAKAFVPMTITTTYQGPNGQVMYVCQGDLGESFMFTFAPELKTVAKTGEAEYAVPDIFCWLPLKSAVELVSDPSLFTKTANKTWTGTVEILGDRNEFSFRGAPLAKIATGLTKFIDRSKAEFLGVALGVHPNFIKEALDKASQGNVMTLTGLRPLISAKEKIAAAKIKVKEALVSLDPPIKNYFLVKEAAILDDAMTADKILGLGFLNAENVASFVDMLPGLETASSKLAELLIAVRLGLKDIPEAAVERMLMALENVIKGLKSLKQKEISFA